MLIPLGYCASQDMWLEAIAFGFGCAFVIKLAIREWPRA